MVRINGCTCALFLVVVVAMCGGVGWRQDRKPKMMGDKIPMKIVLPHTKKVQRKIVLYHNYFRRSVVPRASNMLRMKWRKDVAKAAQRWANNCMFLTHDGLAGRHVENFGSCGQNIFVSSHLVPWLFAIKTWFLEKDNFTYGSPNNDLKIVGHYTQLVWATTHQVGCGLAKCQRNGDVRGKTYYNYVCNYCPIGNREATLGRPYRKGRPCRACKKHCYRKKLCLNSCPTADYWANCRELHEKWPEWLCSGGAERGHFCNATCTCRGRIHD